MGNIKTLFKIQLNEMIKKVKFRNFSRHIFNIPPDDI